MLHQKGPLSWMCTAHKALQKLFGHTKKLPARDKPIPGDTEFLKWYHCNFYNFHHKKSLCIENKLPNKTMSTLTKLM